MKLRRVLLSLGVFIAVGFVYFLVSLLQVWNTGRSADRQPVDAIVVLGAAQYDGRPSPQFQARLDHVLELWNLNLASYIVVTGGKQQGDRFTEAATARKFFVLKGVSSDLIFEENSGTTTYASLLAVSQIASQKKITRVLIVSDPFHLLRAKLIAKEVGLDAGSSSTRSSVIQGGDAFKRNLQEATGVAVGRIVGFDRVDSWTN
ncbi:MAG: YdcF family protein [Actinobacteria bacterium]|nr:YdcF family protein [Actinomycetota bacterium]MDA3016515.1 YdcF family protein [Actinomycetota bacterium]